ncbi:MAG TPA: DMT family transporter [Candidatus Limnocylindrales bacterium]|nr:DMT family transporter [Candidatus Limnocylindrales bacterium]
MRARIARHRASLSLVLAAACWGLGTVVSKRAVGEVAPLTLLVVQLGASVVLLGAVSRLRRRSSPLPDVPPALARLGLLNPGLAYALGLIGLTQISASLSVLLWAAEPVLILALAAVVLRERVGPGFVGLSAAAVAGMLLVVYEPGTTGSLPGIVISLAGVLCCAVYTVATRRWLAGADGTFEVVVAQQAYALLFALAALVLVQLVAPTAGLGDVTPVGWLSAVGSGILYYGLAYVLYLDGLRQTTASSAAASFYLIPVFGVVGAMVGLGERLGPLEWLGAGVIIGAVALLLRSRAGTTGSPLPVAEPPSAVREQVRGEQRP